MFVRVVLSPLWIFVLVVSGFGAGCAGGSTDNVENAVIAGTGGMLEDDGTMAGEIATGGLDDGEMGIVAGTSVSGGTGGLADTGAAMDSGVNATGGDDATGGIAGTGGVIFMRTSRQFRRRDPDR